MKPRGMRSLFISCCWRLCNRQNGPTPLKRVSRILELLIQRFPVVEMMRMKLKLLNGDIAHIWKNRIIDRSIKIWRKLYWHVSGNKARSLRGHVTCEAVLKSDEQVIRFNVLMDEGAAIGWNVTDVREPVSLDDKRGKSAFRMIAFLDFWLFF